MRGGVKSTQTECVKLDEARAWLHSHHVYGSCRLVADTLTTLIRRWWVDESSCALLDCVVLLGMRT